MPSHSLAAKLRRFRAESRLSQLEIARRTGALSQQAVSQFERGLEPTDQQLRLLADALGVSITKLVTRRRP